MEIETAAVIGLGLIGGSVARELSARGMRVLAADVDRASCAAAIAEGVVERVLSPDLSGIEAAELIVLATPVRAAAGILETVARRERARLITDVGSTKGSLLACAERLGVAERFVGAHPLTGDHRSGWGASRLSLFAGATVFLTPTSATSAPALSAAMALWQGLGALPRLDRAEAHDQRMAWCSHLPQVLASALAAALASARLPRGELGPGGRDMTRLAAGSADVWREIVEDNAPTLIPALRAMEESLAGIRLGLERGESAEFARVFAAGREWAAADSAMPGTENRVDGPG